MDSTLSPREYRVSGRVKIVMTKVPSWM